MKNATCQRVPTQFGPDVEFEVTPVPRAEARSMLNAELQKLLDELVEQLLRQTHDPDLRSRLQQAASDAAALVWSTPFPLLLMPVLLEEKAQAARVKLERQDRIERRSREILEMVQ